LKGQVRVAANLVSGVFGVVYADYEKLLLVRIVLDYLGAS